MKSEQEIREHISNLEKMLFNPMYSDETKRLFLVEIQVLKAVLNEE